ncbi:MAG: response regulator transcription factor [Acidobacteriota bacterium]|jgi:DNA-binding NarL/FixJ family response regulator
MSEGGIAVAVVEDDRITREGLSLLLRASPGFSLAGAYGSVEEAMAREMSAPPDVILLDLHLPGRSGCEGVELFKQRFPHASVLMLTVFEDTANIFRCLCAGADGYILKRTPPAELLGFVREAVGGGAPMSPEVARKLVTLFRRIRPDPEVVEAHLSEQETRLVRLLADGHNYESAGRELGITVNTVRKHVRSVYQKLHVHSKAEAVSKALRAGLI